jgi:hypothetical protein
MLAWFLRGNREMVRKQEGVRQRRGINACEGIY